MTTLAFIECDETGFVPCHVKDIKQGDVFYLVIDGVRQEIHRATTDAYPDRKQDNGWNVESAIYE